MRKDVRQNRKQHVLIQSAAGLALGMPLALSAAEMPRPPAIQRTAATTEAAPVSAQAAQEKPQFQPDQYQSEVQRQLNLLYQQNSQPGTPSQGATLPPPPPAGNPPARKMRMKDVLSPSAWKRQYHRWQRERKLSHRQHDETQTPQTQLGAPADVTLGGAAPSAVAPEFAPSVPIPATQPAVPRLNLPEPVAASPSQPVANPATAAARPQLQRVSPEIFAEPASEPAPLGQFAASDSPTPSAELLLAPSPNEPGLLPTPTSAAPSFIETPVVETPVAESSVAETPLLILLPNPEQTTDISMAKLPSAPPAQEPQAAGTLEPIAAPAVSDGFIDESAEFPATTAGGSVNETVAATNTLAPAAEPNIAEAPLEASANPFTGLELESNPFAAPTAAADLSSTSPGEFPEQPLTAPASLSKPAAQTEAPAALTAPARTTPAPQPESTPAEVSSPAPLAAPPKLDAHTSVPQTTVVLKKAAPATAATGPRADVQRKLSRIAERKGLTGFKGFCPVMLKDYRELVDAKLEHTVIYEGRQYWFSSAAARETFLLDPAAYVPARGGIDVVLFDNTGESREGSLDHAVWYRGQLYLFDSAETRGVFAKAPQAHAATP